MLRVGPLIIVPSLIRQLGGDPEAILAQAGITLQWLSAPEHRLSYSTRCRLLAVCREQLDCPHFGLLLGQRVDLWHMGMLGVLMRCARSVGDALGQLARYQNFHTQQDALRIEAGTHSVLLSYREPLAAPGSEQVGDAILAGLCALLRALCGPRWAPTQVFFAHPAPSDPLPFSDYFKCPLVFSEPAYALSFAPRWLKKEIANVDEGLFGVITREVEKALIVAEGSFVSTVRAAIENALKAGSSGAEPVAAALGLPVRTMNRRLEKEGAAFRQLLDEARYNAATLMLKDSRQSICRIAESLGYSETASFTRAFRRWSGKTPVAWRSTLRPIADGI